MHHAESIYDKCSVGKQFVMISLGLYREDKKGFKFRYQEIRYRNLNPFLSSTGSFNLITIKSCILKTSFLCMELNKRCRMF